MPSTVSLFCSARAPSYECGLRMSTRRFVTVVIVVYIFRTDASASGWGITSATNVSCMKG